MPKVFYGLHMEPGTAEYKNPGEDAYRIFLNEQTLKQMDGTFVGKPVYVEHVDGVDLENLQKEADGYVVKSFFNQFDGKHWVQFLAVSDRAQQAIRDGWKLSNAYHPKDFGPGGQHHAVTYAKEVTRGEYEHLAIVPNPRYEASVIMPPEEFAEYNRQKELDLKRFTNSKDKGVKSMFNIFKRTKVENAVDFAETVVELPKSKIEKTIAQIINDMDDLAVAAQAPGGMDMPVAGEEQFCMVGDQKMKIKDLVQQFMELKSAAARGDDSADAVLANDEDEKDKKEKADKEAKEKKENEEKAASEKKQNDLREKELGAADFLAIKNAREAMQAMEDAVTNSIELVGDQVARGKKRYGSGN